MQPCARPTPTGLENGRSTGMGWRLSAVGITRPPELRTGPPWDRDRRHPGTWRDRGRGLLVQDQEFLRVDVVTRFEISDMVEAAEVTRRVLERRLMIECSRSDSGQTPVHMLSGVSSGARIHSRRRVESSGWLRHARKGDAGVPLVPARQLAGVGVRDRISKRTTAGCARVSSCVAH